jgi:hypothetical protein
MRNNTHSCIIISFQKGFDTNKIIYEKLLSMCAMHVYVHLAHNFTLDYVPSVVML